MLFVRVRIRQWLIWRHIALIDQVAFLGRGFDLIRLLIQRLIVSFVELFFLRRKQKLDNFFVVYMLNRVVDRIFVLTVTFYARLYRLIFEQRTHGAMEAAQQTATVGLGVRALGPMPDSAFTQLTLIRLQARPDRRRRVDQATLALIRWFIIHLK